MKKIILFFILAFLSFNIANASSIKYLDIKNDNNYLIDSFFKITSVSSDKPLEIQIKPAFINKTNYDFDNNQICIYSFDKKTLEKINLISCSDVYNKKVKKVNIDTLELSGKEENIKIVKFDLSSIKNSYYEYYYGIGIDYIDLNNITFTSDKDNYSMGEEIIIRSNKIKTLAGKEINSIIQFYMPEKDIYVYSTGGIVEYKTQFSKPGSYNIFFKYFDYTNRNIGKLFTTNTFQIEEGEYYKIDQIKPDAKLIDDDIKITFPESHTIENITIGVDGLEKTYNDVVYKNEYNIDKNLLLGLLFLDKIPDNSTLEIKGYNLKDNEYIYTDIENVDLEYKEETKIIEDTNSVSLSYLTGTTDYSLLLDDIVSTYNEEEINEFSKKYENQIDDYKSNYNKRLFFQKINIIKNNIIEYYYVLIFLFFIIFYIIWKIKYRNKNKQK